MKSALLLILSLILVVQCSEKKPKAPVLEYESALYKSGSVLTIEDTFRLLPYKALASANNVKERDAILKSQRVQRQAAGSCANELEQVDTSIGYIRYTCRGDKKTDLVEVAAWKREGKPDLIGVNETTISSGMSSVVKFYEFANGGWTEVTSTVFPSLGASDFGGEGTTSISLYVQFSQFDRNIVVQPAMPLPTGQEKIMGARRTLKWSEGRFVKD